MPRIYAVRSSGYVWEYSHQQACAVISWHASAGGGSLGAMENRVGKGRMNIVSVLSVAGLATILAFALVIPLLPTARSADVAIAIGDNFFNPDTKIVEVGDRVVWTNQGGLVHTVTSPSPAGVLDSGNIAP